jgi:hypothetical protein
VPWNSVEFGHQNSKENTRNIVPQNIVPQKIVRKGSSRKGSFRKRLVGTGSVGKSSVSQKIGQSKDRSVKRAVSQKIEQDKDRSAAAHGTNRLFQCSGGEQERAASNLNKQL